MRKFFPSNDRVCEQHDLSGLAFSTDATAGSATDAIVKQTLKTAI